MSHSYTLSDEEKKWIDEYRNMHQKVPIKELNNEKANNLVKEAQKETNYGKKIDLLKKAVYLYEIENINYVLKST